jgi:hypothetical protein
VPLFLSGVIAGCSQNGQEPQSQPGARPVVDQGAGDQTEGLSESVKPAEFAGTTRTTPDRPSNAFEDLQAAIKAANPDFGGDVQLGPMQTETGMVVVAAINDPAVEDIGPLADVPIQGIDLSMTRVSNLSPLEGKPLRVLYLESTPVDDISVAAGMPLEDVYLAHTNVEDITPLEEAPLRQLNLVGSKVGDLSPLANQRHLKMLWLNDTPVSDLGPLKSVPLVSLTLAGSKVSDLSPLKGHPTLERLHIARTPVTDLSVLRWLTLSRLIFTPSRIKTGIQYARNMPTLREIGTAFGEQYGNDSLPPSEFWKLYDAGKFR